MYSNSVVACFTTYIIIVLCLFDRFFLFLSFVLLPGHLSQEALTASALSDLWTMTTSVLLSGRILGVLIGGAVGAGNPKLAGETCKVPLNVSCRFISFHVVSYRCASVIKLLPEQYRLIVLGRISIGLNYWSVLVHRNLPPGFLCGPIYHRHHCGYCLESYRTGMVVAWERS